MIRIVQGAQVQIPLRLLNRQNGVITGPVNLTGMFDIKTCFQNVDGSETILSLQTTGITIVGNPLLGQISISLTAAQTALLSPSDPGQLQLSLVATEGADPQKIAIFDAYRIIATIC